MSCTDSAGRDRRTRPGSGSRIAGCDAVGIRGDAQRPQAVEDCPSTLHDANQVPQSGRESPPAWGPYGRCCRPAGAP